MLTVPPLSFLSISDLNHKQNRLKSIDIKKNYKAFALNLIDVSYAKMTKPLTHKNSLKLVNMVTDDT